MRVAWDAAACDGLADGSKPDTQVLLERRNNAGVSGHRVAFKRWALRCIQGASGDRRTVTTVGSLEKKGVGEALLQLHLVQALALPAEVVPVCGLYCLPPHRLKFNPAHQHAHLLPKWQTTA